MPDTDIGNADNITFTSEDYSVDSATTDSADGQKEYRYQNTNWATNYGFYKNTSQLKISIDTKSTWTVGKGYVADEMTELTLMNITGFGKDSFNSILANMIRVYHIAGDAFAEIIRDKTDKLINLKPLAPDSIVVVFNSKGVITKYEQVNKLGRVNKTFQPDQIFHLSRNRTADEVHGVSLVDSVKWNVETREELRRDYRKLLHRNVYPVRIWHVDTDDETEIDSIKTKIAQSKGEAEDIIIPKGCVETEIAGTAPNATLNPLPFISQLESEFYQETGVPRVVVGGSVGMTEASVKIEYLAFEQTVENEQLYIEEQTLAQLNLEIDLQFPASLQNELISDQSKAETMQANTPEDTSITNMGASPAEIQ